MSGMVANGRDFSFLKYFKVITETISNNRAMIVKSDDFVLSGKVRELTRFQLYNVQIVKRGDFNHSGNVAKSIDFIMSGNKHEIRRFRFI